MYKYCSPSCEYGEDLCLFAYNPWILLDESFQDISEITHKTQWRHWFLMAINEMQTSKHLKIQKL